MADSERQISVRPRPDLAVEYIDDDVVVLDRKLGKIHQLNHTASIVWKGIAAGQSWGRIAASLVDRFEVSADTAQHDVEKLIDQFGTMQLLEASQ